MMISPPKRNKKTFSGWISCLPFSPIWNRSHRWKPNKTMMEYIQTTIKDHRQRLYSNHHQRIYSKDHHEGPPSKIIFRPAPRNIFKPPSKTSIPETNLHQNWKLRENIFHQSVLCTSLKFEVGDNQTMESNTTVFISQVLDICTFFMFVFFK